MVPLGVSSLLHEVLTAHNDVFDKSAHVILGCTGSVASIKVPLIAERLQEKCIKVVVVPTKRALHFLKATAEDSRDIARKQSEAEKVLEFNTVAPLQENTLLAGDFSSESVCGNIKKSDPRERKPSFDDNSCSSPQYIHSINCCMCRNSAMDLLNTNSSGDELRKTVNPLKTSLHCGELETLCDWCDVQRLYPSLTFAGDELEWACWERRGDPVLHIQLRRWADLAVLAPLSANTLGKLACGLCDDLLSSTVRAWDLQKPLLFCPAMNTFMYEHPITARHIRTLKEFGYREVPSVTKKLVCGDLGSGAMAEVESIVGAIEAALDSSKKF